MAVGHTVSSQGSLLPPILRLPLELRLKIIDFYYFLTKLYAWCGSKIMTHFLARIDFSQQSYVPVVLSIDDTNDNTTLILRANFSISIVDPKDRGDDASKLLRFLENHTKFEHLVLEFWV